MPGDLVDSEVAALVAGVTARAIQYAARDGRLVNYSAARNRVQVSLEEVVAVYGDHVGIT